MPAEAILELKVRAQSMVMSFEDDFRIAMVAILVGLFLVILLKRGIGAH